MYVYIYIHTLIWISMRVQQQLWNIPPSYNLGYSYIGVYSCLFPPKDCCPFEQQIYTVYIAHKHTHTHSHTVCTHYVICIKYFWINFTGFHYISINYTTSANFIGAFQGKNTTVQQTTNYSLDGHMQYVGFKGLLITMPSFANGTSPWMLLRGKRSWRHLVPTCFIVLSQWFDPWEANVISRDCRTWKTSWSNRHQPRMSLSQLLWIKIQVDIIIQIRKPCRTSTLPSFVMSGKPQWK